MNKKLIKAILIIVTFILLVFLFNSKFTVNRVKGWNILIIKSSDIYTTDSWFTYTKKHTFAKFTMYFPINWKTDGFVFTDEKGEKVAELSPGLVELKPNQSCFDSKWENESGQSEMISLKDIRIGSLNGKLLIEKAPAFNGTTNDEYLYPHYYCLSDGKMAFVIALYEKNVVSGNEEFYNKMLSNLKF